MSSRGRIHCPPVGDGTFLCVGYISHPLLADVAGYDNSTTELRSQYCHWPCLYRPLRLFESVFLSPLLLVSVFRQNRSVFGDRSAPIQPMTWFCSLPAEIFPRSLWITVNFLAISELNISLLTDDKSISSPPPAFLTTARWRFQRRIPPRNPNGEHRGLSSVEFQRIPDNAHLAPVFCRRNLSPGKKHSLLRRDLFTHSEMTIRQFLIVGEMIRANVVGCIIVKMRVVTLYL